MAGDAYDASAEAAGDAMDTAGEAARKATDAMDQAKEQADGGQNRIAFPARVKWAPQLRRPL